MILRSDDVSPVSTTRGASGSGLPVAPKPTSRKVGAVSPTGRAPRQRLSSEAQVSEGPMGGAVEGSVGRGAGRGRRRGTLLAALLLATTGVVMVLWGMPKDLEAPLPPRPVAASPGQLPAGPETTEIDGAVLTAADLEPRRLFIPAIGAYAPIVDSDVRAGELSIPADAAILARWGGSAALGASAGNTLIAGHVTNGSQRGALFNLAELDAGHRAYLTDETGAVHRFQLESLTAVVKAALPDEVWEKAGARRLTVVTCGGPVTETKRGLQYRDNVIAVFVEEPTGAVAHPQN